MEAFGREENDPPMADRRAGESVDAERVDLERALARLPDTARLVVWLHDVEGYTHAEISELLGGTPSLSKSQLARAHQRLREMLEPSGAIDPCLPVSTTN
jgi:RNA polymerase sigma-70 factor (ECF subfamily)